MIGEQGAPRHSFRLTPSREFATLGGMKHVWILALSLGFVPLLQAEPEIRTHTYVVPPTFLKVNPDGTRGWYPATESPQERYRSRQRETARPTAKAILEDAGIEFPSGASAIYNPATSQLIVKNTPEQLARVEAYIDTIRSGVEKQLYLTVRELRFRGDLKDHFDAASRDTDFRIYVDEILPNLWPVSDEAPVLSEGKIARVVDSYDSFREELSRPPRSPEELLESRRLGRATTLSDPQFQVLIRFLSQIGGVELDSFPSVMVLPGQPAFVQVEDFRLGAIPVLGEAESLIDLDLFIPERGKALYDPGTSTLRPSASVTLADGNTVAIAEKNASGENRVLFVTAQLMDPAGMPISTALPPPVPPPMPETADSSQADDRETGSTKLSPEDHDSVRQADEFAIKASRLLGDGASIEASYLFERALETLPRHETTDSRRRAYEGMHARAKGAVARRMSETGWHIVQDGQSLEQIAGETGVEVAALRKANRLGDLAVKPGQMLLVPAPKVPPSATETLLKETVLPEFDFAGARLAECVAALQIEILRVAAPEYPDSAMPVFIFDVPEKALRTEITLRLSNVPAAEALRYVASLAQCRFTVKGREVTLAPVGD